MKKLNLKFFGLGTKMVLPLFLLFGLFLMSSTAATAQYVPEGEAVGILKGHVEQIPDVAPPMKASQDMYSPQEAERMTDYYRKMFGMILIQYIHVEGKKVSKAINDAITLAENRGYPDYSIDVIKDEYVELLTQ